MTTLLYLLRTAHHQEPDTVARLLNLTESQYQTLEATGTALTHEQITTLASFYQVDFSNFLNTTSPANHNLGPNSRGIIFVTNYYEKYTVIKKQAKSPPDTPG